ncbi:MAG: hypothetical protein GTO18_20715 [Anaerolineales bacterium]|nr:hypothetical protein [Anaerolineales bacterium]
MTATYEADVALIHVAGGSSRTTPPPGTIAQSAPRRAARGRSDDLFFLNLSLHPDHTSAPGLTAHLAHLGADAYFGTPGSVTAGLREAAAVINDHLLDANQAQMEDSQLQGNLLLAVLRGNNFVSAQIGIGQLFLVRPDVVTRLASQEATKHPLGTARIPQLRYYHLEVQAGDNLILTTAEPPVWSDPTLSTIANIDPAKAVDRLTIDVANNLTGMVIGIASPGSLTSSTVTPHEPPRGTQPPPVKPIRTTDILEFEDAIPTPKRPSRVSGAFQGVGRGIRNIFSNLGYSFANIMARLSPGVSEPKRDSFSPKALAAIAVIVPLIVVAIASIFYLETGRAQQFEFNMSDARDAIIAAEEIEDPVESYTKWVEADFYLNEASSYGSSDELVILQEKVRSKLDILDNVMRLDFQPVITGGFGSNARLSALAATSLDLYVLDSKNEVVQHIWWTGRGFDINPEFQCFDGSGNTGTMSNPVDMITLTDSAVLGVEALLAIDEDGTLLYCAPDTNPRTAELTSPDIGWGSIQAFDLYNDRLYVLDPSKNSVWIFDATGGIVTGFPSLYFVDIVPDLSEAIDIAGTPEGLYILYSDGLVDLCLRTTETDPETGSQFRVLCEHQTFKDERVGRTESESIPGALPIEIIYSPPPEPSLYFLDNISEGVFQFNTGLLFQSQYIPLIPFKDDVTSFALGPQNHLYIAVGDQVFHYQLSR